MAPASRTSKTGSFPSTSREPVDAPQLDGRALAREPVAHFLVGRLQPLAHGGAAVSCAGRQRDAEVLLLQLGKEGLPQRRAAPAQQLGADQQLLAARQVAGATGADVG